MSQINTLHRKRGGKKCSLTNFKTYLDKFTIGYTFTSTDIIELKDRIKNIEVIFKEFCEIQDNIEELCEDDALQTEHNARDEFSTEYYKLLAVAKDYVKNNDTQPDLAQVNIITASDANTSLQTDSRTQVKLPTIKLPTFSGNYDHWVEFKDMFLSLIDKNSKISNIEKLQYLKSSLSGQAAQLIISLEITDVNYNVAWQILCDRYDNKKLLVNNHIKALFNLPVVRNEVASDLRKLVDEFSKHLLALKALEQKVDNWDPLLLYILTNKLDAVTKREWEISQSNKSETNIEDIKLFLKGRCNVLESLDNQKRNVNLSRPSTSLLAVKSQRTCGICKKENHNIHACTEFLNLSINDRIKTVKQKRLCFNCLKYNHTSVECKAGNCKKCSKKHNTLLHLDTNNEELTASQTQPNTTIVSCNTIHSNVLLSTAEIHILHQSGKFVKCRALLDCGSEQNFVTWELFEKLDLPKTAIDLTVIGINQVKSAIKYRTELTLCSIHNNFSRKISCLIINKITDNIPNSNYNISMLKIPENIDICDPNFNKSSKVDILLGANIFWDLLRPQQVKLGKNQPTIQKTVLGWIMSGPIPCNNKEQFSVCNFVKNVEIQDDLKAFWEIEECDGAASVDDSFCDTFFKKTTIRDDTGRFIVNIPFKQPTPALGNSYEIALKRFTNLEKKLENNIQLKEDYIAFMSEYKLLNHMSEINDPMANIDNSYYLPHHGVLKQSSTTTKLRVVFDGSCKTTNNLSLNDIQYKGPTIQSELWHILLRFRVYKYILSADIEKMYRQILISEKERDYQRILWRETPNANLNHYRLNTVTYGTKSAPYLAIRSLQELAHIYTTQYPRSSNIILKDFYVDDLLTGTNTIDDAITIYNELNSILKTAGFQLRKWVTNDSEISNIINSNTVKPHDVLNFNSTESKRTLGLVWHPVTDTLHYEIANDLMDSQDTKRTVLSQISRIFDPLGLLGPFIINAKILLQQIWMENLEWDTVLPDHISKKWKMLKGQLSELIALQIPRYIVNTNAKVIELHSFSDASISAYGACLYIRTVSETNDIQVHLLCAKSRVTPLKRLTIPKLELCAALLSAKLVNMVQKGLPLEFVKTYLWCDSTIVLHWLRLTPNDLKIFVSNRISQIQKLTNMCDWYYVRSKNNPADLISRGMAIAHLSNSDWYHGPSWLNLSQSNWPVESPEMNCELPELKGTCHSLTTFSRESNYLIDRYASFDKLKRIVAYCLRFIRNCKVANEIRNKGTLTVSELNEAMKRLVGLAQLESFTDEIRYLKNKTKVTPKLNFRYLSPFLDEENLLRVGGRLKHSNFEIGKKHPLLLCGKHPLTKLIMEGEHLKLLHGGPQLMLASIRSNYWPTGGRNLAKKIVHNCIKCFKAKPKPYNQFMGDLPKDRLTLTYPFLATGVDYAGPFQIKQHKGRSNKIYKCYLCLFICLSTKAIHIEPVTELTTEAFISTFKRFIARRGKPKDVYSDNGTNFLGASSKLRDLGKFLRKNRNKLTSIVSNDNVTWHFNPAQSPHFGGLWEAGIKSAKHHIRRTIGTSLITFENFLTLLTEIESILNSRPLCPLSTSPDDYEVLTPSHFLIGRSATSLPDRDWTATPTNRLKQYEHIQKMKQHFWKRWSSEYISELQTRTKWLKHNKNLQQSQLVLLKDENLPPLRWKMARITEVHPGADGVVRVVSVTTGKNVLKRAVSKLCVLPIPENDY